LVEDAAEANDAAEEIGTPPEAAPDGACSTPPAAGDLQIQELMIASVAGTGDYGEWLEVQNMRSCTLTLRGLHGDCPSGAKVRTFDVIDDVWIPPSGTFVVADSEDPSINHSLPGTLLVWAGHPGDVLRNNGSTISLRWQGALIDTVTYPAFKLSVGASLAFPADCPPFRRSDWSAWQPSNASWFPGFRGTPNAPNSDVQCP
jgi:hypothetical protein